MLKERGWRSKKYCGSFINTDTKIVSGCKGIEDYESCLVVGEAVVRAELHDLLVGGGAAEETQPGVGDLLQHPPQHVLPGEWHLN